MSRIGYQVGVIGEECTKRVVRAGGWYYQGKEFRATGGVEREREKMGTTQETQTAVHAAHERSRQH